MKEEKNDLGAGLIGTRRSAAPQESTPSSPDARTPGETPPRTPEQLRWIVDHNEQIRGGHRAQLYALADTWASQQAQIARLEQALTDAARAYNADVERVEGKESTLRSE